jgi:hypothetical protein
MVAPLGGSTRSLGAPTINDKNINGGPPWDAVMEIWECPPSTQETSTAAPLGGDVRELGAPTVNAKNIDSGPPILRGGGGGGLFSL